MSDTLDLINTVRINDLAVTNDNRDVQYDLDRRADRLERKTGERPMDWDEFNTQISPAKPDSGWSHAGDWAMKGAIAGAVILGAITAFRLGAAAFLSGAASEVATISVFALPLAAAMGAAIGSVSGAVLSMFDDQKPEIRRDQLAKYRSYLDDFEKSHAPTRTPEIEQETCTKWRDQMMAQKQMAQDRVPG